MTATWTFARGTQRLLANLTDHARSRPSDFAEGRPIWGGSIPAQLAPWSVYWSIG
jgi:hypothetical protein